MKRVGFTGTSVGMTNDQVLQVHMLLGDLKTAGAKEATHGMCIGADTQFHQMAKALGYFTIGCPGVTAEGRLWKRSRACRCDLTMPEKFFLVRNRHIVEESELLIATPKERHEQIRGGTWATIRYARKLGKPLMIVWPDGSSVVEHVPGVSTVDQYRESLVRG